VAVIPSLSRDLGLGLQLLRNGRAEMFRLRRGSPALNMTGFTAIFAVAGSDGASTKNFDIFSRRAAQNGNIC